MNDTKLRAALIEARDWFESQAKAVSKGCGSSYELHDLRVQRDALDAALAAAQAQDAGQLTQGDLREFCAIGRATNRAAGDLPDFARIRIDLENGGGTVYWLDNKSGQWRYIDSGDLFSTQIDAAIDAAIAAKQGGANG